MTDALALAQALIRCRSVTPADDGALDVVQRHLEGLGFRCTRLRFNEVDNLHAIRGQGSPHLMYCGHTDVVPPGDLARWTDDPFAATVRDGVLYGRGACDMKGGIAAFLAAIPAQQPRGTLSLLITGDEEGPSVDGVKRCMPWLAGNGLLPGMCIVGEPTSQERLGDVIKIGRRGSLNAFVTVQGTQGHSAYPQKADNPVHRLVAALAELTARPLDAGSAHFEPSTLQVTGLRVDNTATNVIPAQASCFLNIRFNDHHSGAALEAMLRDVLARHAPRHELRVEVSGESFVTQPGPFVEALSQAVQAECGVAPRLDTGGGTSDARFIAAHCPVAELGGVGRSLHQVDENVPVAELHALSRLYARVIAACLAA
ncbi:succinyl-diaminopimelate desuccinylase [Roseococcus sp. DSY-14]|uniref:succinyl-diaminopimelate desuccinylase n=1 Tax=Roseococcus sp. DSY-14 TaxID=3369650 RepID=UPI00387B2425